MLRTERTVSMSSSNELAGLLRSVEMFKFKFWVKLVLRAVASSPANFSEKVFRNWCKKPQIKSYPGWMPLVIWM